MSTPNTTCPECGNPYVSLIWGGDITHNWTGSCEYCGSILFATKEEVSFYV